MVIPFGIQDICMKRQQNACYAMGKIVVYHLLALGDANSSKYLGYILLDVLVCIN